MSVRPDLQESDGRWYEFTQHDTFSRPVYVKAASLAEARRRIGSEGVPDFPPNFPELRIDRRGHLSKVDDAYVESLRDHG